MLKQAAHIGALVALAACVSQEQVVSPETAGTVSVVSVDTDAASAASATDRGFELSASDAAEIVDREVEAVLSQAPATGSRDVSVDLDVTRIFVPNPASAVVGQSGPVVEATARLVDASTGQVVGEAFSLRADGAFRGAGALGAVLATASLGQGGEADEIRAAARNLGRELALAIYGIDPTQSE